MADEKQAIEALNKYSDTLSNLENVVGLGVVQADGNFNKIDADMAVAVYVKKKLPKSKLHKSQIVPEQLELRIDNKQVKVKIRVIEQGEVVLEEKPSLDKL